VGQPAKVTKCTYYSQCCQLLASVFCQIKPNMRQLPSIFRHFSKILL
jgi:hypothetical protein